jgi:methanol metabolism-related c-type cytochrome
VNDRIWTGCAGAAQRLGRVALVVSAVAAAGGINLALAAPKQPASSDDGKYADADGNPTYSVGADGKVDWYTFSGYRRYHSECHVCHGPDGAGSTYAPALADSLKTMDYATFLQTVTQGRKNVGNGNEKVMPSFATNRNVMCYVDDIYVYLKARADGALGRVRPEDHEAKPQSAKAAEDACMGNS